MFFPTCALCMIKKRSLMKTSNQDPHLIDFTLANVLVYFLSLSLELEWMKPLWICYSLDALYTQNKPLSTCGTRQQLCHFTAHKNLYKKDYFFLFLSLKFSITQQTNTLSLSLSTAAFCLSVSVFSFNSNPNLFQFWWGGTINQKNKQKKRVPLFLGFSSLHYMYIQHSCYILRWWCFYIQVFGRGGGRGGGSGSGSNKPDCVLCLSAQGHFLSALSVSTIQRWWYTIALCVLCDVREKRKCCFK